MEQNIQRSLGQGLVGSENTTLYVVPNKISCTTTQIQFTNKSASSVVLNIYKQTNGVDFILSPNNFILKANFTAQDDGSITLGSNDSLIAIADTDGVIEYVINGIETPNP